MYKKVIAFGPSRTIPRFLSAIIALFAVSISVCAKKNPNDAISATIAFPTAVKVGNTQLAAGVYKVTADGREAKFQQGKKVVAQVPCTLKALSNTPITTQYSSDSNGHITEIQVKEQTKAIEFSP